MTSAAATSPQASTGLAFSRPDRRAWGVLALLTFVYVVNFLDRQLLSILAKPIQDTLHITDGQLGLIGGLYFAFFYGFIALPIGWLADRTNRVTIPTMPIAMNA
jgi:sugar phosphate permease